MAAGDVPGFELMYQTGNYDAGQPGKSVFKNLANPPADAVASENVVKNRFKSKGNKDGASRDVLSAATSNRDFIRDHDDHVSIYDPYTED